MDKHYKEHSGTLVRKYRNVFGKYVFVIAKNTVQCKVYVGKGIYDDTALGTLLTVGEIHRKLVNLRFGIYD